MHQVRKKKQRMLELMEPDYMEKFCCTGSLCPDTCCQEWDIVIDPATCERYEKSEDPEFRRMLSRAIVHREEQGTAGAEEVACIRLGQGGRCLFLRNDGLCMIQRRTEERNLSETCRTYPRVIYVWNENYAERALCVSCPAAASLILGHKGPLRFVSRPIAAAAFAGLRITDEGKRLSEECLPLRRELLAILQDQGLPLLRRLQMADDFFWRAGALSGRRVDRRFHVLAQEEEAARQRLAEGTAEKMPVPSLALAEQELLRLQQILSLRLESRSLRPAFREQLEQAVYFWGMTESLEQESIERYRDAQRRYAAELVPQYSQVLENYVVNGVFKNIFVLEDEEAFYIQWFRLVLQLAVVRLLLMTAVEDADGSLPSCAEVFAIIQRTTRVIGHDSLYLRQAAAVLSGGGREADALRDFCRPMLLERPENQG